jgi:non-specific serine/threonine protein kinase/serine/threonine-protein kinase
LDFERERKLFSLCLPLTPPERDDYLNRECADTDLRLRVERLLEAHARATTDPFFLRLPAGDIPDLIGRYQLTRVIGEGGMGTVYEAEQKEPIRRPVALKIIKIHAGGDGVPAEALARFMAERQALAVMDHPNVAKVFDAGETLLGYPYFVMELVAGQPVTGYCEERGLEIRERLGIFSQLCQAVQHAHQKGVIHRDLKPGNVLVTAAGDEPLVKVIDFGIAKAIEADPAAARLTQAAGPLGTPAYMSPEQASFGTSDIDTRSDIYSLGVILYELVAGVLPAGPAESGYAKFLADLAGGDLRIVPPSGRIPSQDRFREVKGDLDWIVMRALNHDRSRRYPSAAALADDIDRYLRQEPVAAGPPAFSYRFGKFLRRNRVTAVAAAVAALALITGATAATVGYFRANRAEAQARAAAETARAEAVASDRVSQFLADLFEESAPEKARGRQVTAREILDRGAARIQKDLAGEPLLRVRMLRTVGHVYTRMGLYEQAAPLLEEAVRIARGQGAKGELELAAALTVLGRQHRDMGQAAKAEAALTEALRIQQRVSAGHIDTTQTLNELGLLFRVRDPQKALEYYQQSYDIVSAAKGEGEALPMLMNMGAIHLRTNRLQEARDIFEKVLPLAAKHFGDDDPRLAVVLGNLSLAHRNLGNYERALELIRRDHEISLKTLGPDHPGVATVLLTTARILEKCREPGEALDYVERAQAILERRFQPSHGLRMTAENSRAQYLMRLGREREARAVVNELLAMAPESAEGQATRLHSRAILSELDRRSGQLAGALRNARQVIEDPLVKNFPDTLADAHWLAAYALAGQAKTGSARPEEADAARLAAMEKQSKALRPGSASFLQAKYYACAGDWERSLGLLQEAIKLGFRDSVLLDDPAFAPLSGRPEFASLATVVRIRPR